MTIVHTTCMRVSRIRDNRPLSVNVDEDLLKACSHRICQQRTYDKKPLGIAVVTDVGTCCGVVLMVPTPFL